MSDVNQFDKMAAQFKDVAELRVFADAQFKTIIALNKEITELKTQLVQNAATPSSIIQFPTFSLTPEEEICIEQLNFLRSSSKGRELTLEEAKKTEIYTKLLLNIRGGQKDVDGKFKTMSADELLKITEEMPK